MFNTGYYTIGRFRGAPIRIHWTAPIGAVFFGGFALVPGFWLGFLLLIFLHELGHAIVVRACGLRVSGIEIHGLGGQCRYEGYPDSLRTSLIAWGGVWAQMILFASVQLALLFVAPPATSWVLQLIHAFTSVNLWLMAINLIPIRPLDGADAWPLFGILWERWKRRRQIRISAAPIPRPAPPKPAPKPQPKYSERVEDPDRSEELFNRLMSNNPLEEEEEER